MPAASANASIFSIWLSRAVMFTRTVASGASTLTMKAMAPCLAASFAISSRFEGSAIASPSSIIRESLCGGDTAREIGKAHAAIRIPVLMKIGDIFHQFAPLLPCFGESPQFDPRLFLDTFEGAYRDSRLGWWHCHPALFHRVV